MIFKSLYPDVTIPEVALTSFVLQRARQLGAKPALIDGPSGRTITYEQLPGLIARVAAGLAQRCGVRPVAGQEPVHGVHAGVAWLAAVAQQHVSAGAAQDEGCAEPGRAAADDDHVQHAGLLRWQGSCGLGAVLPPSSPQSGRHRHMAMAASPPGEDRGPDP